MEHENGNPVKIRGGPAAVFGDERRKKPLFCKKQDGKALQLGWSEKSENLPGQITAVFRGLEDTNDLE